MHGSATEKGARPETPNEILKLWLALKPGTSLGTFEIQRGKQYELKCREDGLLVAESNGSALPYAAFAAKARAQGLHRPFEAPQERIDPQPEQKRTLTQPPEMVVILPPPTIPTEQVSQPVADTERVKEFSSWLRIPGNAQKYIDTLQRTKSYAETARELKINPISARTYIFKAGGIDSFLKKVGLTLPEETIDAISRKRVGARYTTAPITEPVQKPAPIKKVHQPHLNKHGQETVGSWLKHEGNGALLLKTLIETRSYAETARVLKLDPRTLATFIHVKGGIVAFAKSINETIDEEIVTALSSKGRNKNPFGAKGPKAPKEPKPPKEPTRTPSFGQPKAVQPPHIENGQMTAAQQRAREFVNTINRARDEKTKIDVVKDGDKQLNKEVEGLQAKKKFELLLAGIQKSNPHISGVHISFGTALLNRGDSTQPQQMGAYAQIELSRTGMQAETKLDTGLIAIIDKDLKSPNSRIKDAARRAGIQRVGAVMFEGGKKIAIGDLVV